MLRKVVKQVQGYRTQDGAGVSLVRVLGNQTVDLYDPFLMLDAFDSTNPSDYMAGFPMHPHRGIETFTFLSKGTMVHEDHLGTKAAIHDGEAQWLTAGSGAFHSEMPQPSKRMLGLQLWLNIPAKDKMKAEPFYHGVVNSEIQECWQGNIKVIKAFKGNTCHLIIMISILIPTAGLNSIDLVKISPSWSLLLKVMPLSVGHMWMKRQQLNLVMVIK